MLFRNFIEPNLSERILRARVLRTASPVSEDAYIKREFGEHDGDVIVLFSGDRNHFSNLIGMHEMLLREIRARVRPGILTRIDREAVPPVVLNVRLARDFRRPKERDDFRVGGAILTPVDWFRSVLIHLRRTTGVDAPAMIISDGSDTELQPLLEMRSVCRLVSSTAVEDLLVMSRARIIIGSGGSSFSAWGAYLAQSHVITIGGQNMSWFALNKATTGRVVEYDDEFETTVLPTEIYNDFSAYANQK